MYEYSLQQCIQQKHKQREPTQHISVCLQLCLLLNKETIFYTIHNTNTHKQQTEREGENIKTWRCIVYLLLKLTVFFLKKEKQT